MINFNEIFKIEPFSMDNNHKKKWYLKNLRELTYYHYKNCRDYRIFVDRLYENPIKTNQIDNLPFLHTNIFKNHTLKTNSKSKISVTLSSSGTTNMSKSKVHLDKMTSLYQSRALSIIYKNILKSKLKIFFIDNKKMLDSDFEFNARKAAIKGFYQLVKEPEYLLDDKNNLDLLPIKKFINKNPKEKFIIFGFTSLIWDKLLSKLEKKDFLKNNNSFLIHGGGWKKMKEKSVSRSKFNSMVKKCLGINKVYNYYGMVEQTGSIFLECEHGYYHSSIFSDIIIRNKDLEIEKLNKPGLIQVMSLLPVSYPGHNLLTEDIGTLHGVDDCKCGRKGKYFSVLGRVEGTEMRGCSDVY